MLFQARVADADVYAVSAAYPLSCRVAFMKGIYYGKSWGVLCVSTVVVFNIWLKYRSACFCKQIFLGCIKKEWSRIWYSLADSYLCWLPWWLEQSWQSKDKPMFTVSFGWVPFCQYLSLFLHLPLFMQMYWCAVMKSHFAENGKPEDIRKS